MERDDGWIILSLTGSPWICAVGVVMVVSFWVLPVLETKLAKSHIRRFLMPRQSLEWRLTLLRSITKVQVILVSRSEGGRKYIMRCFTSQYMLYDAYTKPSAYAMSRICSIADCVSPLYQYSNPSSQRYIPWAPVPLCTARSSLRLTTLLLTSSFNPLGPQTTTALSPRACSSVFLIRVFG